MWSLNSNIGNFLVVQWLGLSTSTAGARVRSPVVPETKIHEPQSVAENKQKQMNLFTKQK